MTLVGQEEEVQEQVGQHAIGASLYQLCCGAN